MCGGDLLALLIVNPQEDYFGKDAVFKLGNNIVSEIQDLIKRVKEHDSIVVYVIDNHLPEEIEFLSLSKHAIRNTNGAKIIDELKPDESIYVIEKRRYSGFYESGLDQLLKDLGIGTLIIAGGILETDIYQTCVDARFRNYEVYLVNNTYGFLDKKSKDNTIAHLKKFYDVEELQMDELHDILHEYNLETHHHFHEHSHNHDHSHEHNHNHEHNHTHEHAHEH